MEISEEKINQYISEAEKRICIKLEGQFKNRIKELENRIEGLEEKVISNVDPEDPDDEDEDDDGGIGIF